MYGTPVVILDQKSTEPGHFVEMFDGALGREASTSRVRIRLLDGVNIRFYNLAFSDNRPFHVISTDAGLQPEPLEVNYVLLGPGERVDTVVDLEPGEDVMLQSQPLDGDAIAPIPPCRHAPLSHVVARVSGHEWAVCHRGTRTGS